MNGPVKIIAFSTLARLAVSGLAAGVYIVRVRDEAGRPGFYKVVKE